MQTLLDDYAAQMYALLDDHALGTDIAGRSWCFRQGEG